MRSIGLYGKVFGGAVAVVVLTALGVYMAAVPSIERSLEQEAERRVEREARWAVALCQRAYDRDARTFDTSAFEGASLGGNDSRFTLVLPGGEVRFDSHESPAAMDDHSTRAEIVHPGTAVTRYSRTLDTEMTYFALPVDIDGELRGYSRVSVPAEERETRMGALRSAIQAGALVAVLVSLAFAGYFAARVARPLKEITAVVAEVGARNTTRRLAVHGDDEIAELARAVNHMADDLQGRRERVERDRREREAIFAALAGGLLAVDEKQNVRFVNDQARVLLGGFEGENPKGHPVWELTRNTALIGVIERCLEEGRRTSGETTIVCDEGERIVEMMAVPMAPSAGHAGGCVLELRDVSDLRRLEAVRRDFVSNVSHELKTPLTAMRGYTEALLDDDSMPETTRRSFLEKAHKNTARLVAIVGDLLSLSRLESDERELAFELLDLPDLTRSVLHDLRDLAESRHTRVQLEIPEVEGELRAQADPQALGMAISNLVANAIQYSPEGGEVRVAFARVGDEVRIDVIDRGPGIPRPEQERVFERFYRVDKARSRKLGGTGLGLAIVRHAMVAHGGRVELESELGQGCRFSLFLPAA